MNVWLRQLKSLKFDISIFIVFLLILLGRVPTLESFLENADHGYQLSMGKQVLLGKFPFVDFFFHYTAQRHKVHLPTLRLYSVYGPYEEPSHLMPTLIAQGLQGKLPPLVNPDIARDYVYVDDVNEAYILAATRATSERGVVYNVGTGIQVRLREVVEVACRVLGITAAPEWGSMPNRQWDSSVWIANNHKIQTELGWFPRYSFEQGFKSMTDWFQQHRPISA